MDSIQASKMYRKVQESQTLLINSQSKRLEEDNVDIVKFGFGQSPFLPPKPVQHALRGAVHHKEYTSVQGDQTLRELIATFHQEHNGLKTHPENILIAPGSKILIFNILLAFQKADIFIPAPAWVSYAPQAQLIGHNTIKVASCREQKWRVTPESLEVSLQSKQHKESVLILNYPGNPDGLTYTEDELEAIANHSHKNNMLVIADEIYGLLDHGMSHHSFANYYPEWTITTTGLSKWCGAGGWRFGAALLSDKLASDMKQTLIGIGSETYSCAPAPVQVAAKEAYKSFQDMRGYIKWQTSILSQLGNHCADKLNEANISTFHPQGGFYLFPDFSHYQEKLKSLNIRTSADMCQRILQDAGVAILPGSAFGMPEKELVARLAYVDFQSPNEESKFIAEEHAPKVLMGIRRLSEWVKYMESL